MAYRRLARDFDPNKWHSGKLYMITESTKKSNRYPMCTRSFVNTHGSPWTKTAERDEEENGVFELTIPKILLHVYISSIHTYIHKYSPIYIHNCYLHKKYISSY